MASAPRILLLSAALVAACSSSPPTPSTPAPAPLASSGAATTAPSRPVAPAGQCRDGHAVVGLEPGGIPGLEAITAELNGPPARVHEVFVSALVAGRPPSLVHRPDAGRGERLVATAGPALKRLADSPAVRTEYQCRRDQALQAKGDDEAPRARSADEIHREMVTTQEKIVADIERALATKDMPAEAHRALLQVLEQQRTSLQKLRQDRSEAEQLAAIERMAVEAYESTREERAHMEASRIEAVKKQWPASMDTLLIQRLDRFVALTDTISWGARLVDASSRKRFADPALEAKPADWKLYFRAGKPSIDAARSFAQAWLAELKARP